MRDAVVLYAATGYTGRLIAAELQARGVRVVLAGRNAQKLDALAGRLDRELTDVAVAPLDDPAALREAAGRGRVVVNCAGPFSRSGEALVHAAADAGAHYLDTTGEQDWIRRVHEVHDALLRGAGVAAVPGMAFSHAPGDCITYLTGQRVAPATDVLLAYHVEGFDMTRGTMHSSLEQLNGLDVAYEDGAWVPGGERPRRAFVTFPEPIGRRLVARYPTGEVVTVPRHTPTRNLRARISTASIAPEAVGALVPSATPLLGLLLRSPVRHLLDRVIDRLPEGPGEAERGAVRYTIVAGATGEDGRTAQGVVTGTDIYGTTSRIVASTAASMLDPRFGRTGALGPAEAVDPAAFLDELGLTWSVT